MLVTILWNEEEKGGGGKERSARSLWCSRYIPFHLNIIAIFSLKKNTQRYNIVTLSHLALWPFSLHCTGSSGFFGERMRPWQAGFHWPGVTDELWAWPPPHAANLPWGAVKQVAACHHHVYLSPSSVITIPESFLACTIVHRKKARITIHLCLLLPSSSFFYLFLMFCTLFHLLYLFICLALSAGSHWKKGWALFIEHMAFQ